MSIIVREKALADIDQIGDWISADNKPAARIVTQKIYRAIARISIFPLLHPAGRQRGTHECHVSGTPYVIVYQPGSADTPSIVQAVFHAAQDRA